MRRVAQSVPLAECRKRALVFLAVRNLLDLVKASSVAYSIWPDKKFKAQGAGAAASRILKGLEKDGLVAWRSTGDDWGYRITSAGLAALREVA